MTNFPNINQKAEVSIPDGALLAKAKKSEETLKAQPGTPLETVCPGNEQ